MRDTEFQNEASRLIAQFGKAAYSPERINVIWREVKDMDARWWMRTVDKFIGECRQAPLLPEIREEAGKERERRYQWEKRARESNPDYQPQGPVCDLCGNSGSFIVNRKEDGAPYAFKCSCPTGQNDMRNLPRWRDQDPKQFELSA